MFKKTYFIAYNVYYSGSHDVHRSGFRCVESRKSPSNILQEIIKKIAADHSILENTVMITSFNRV